MPPIQANTFYLGGGTPALMSPEQLSNVYEALAHRITFAPDLEWTLEANPDGFNQEKMRAFMGLGVNRISLGVQSLDAKVLETSGRTHTPENVFQSVSQLKEAGCSNLNLDLIYGLPHQSLKSWCATLEKICALSPQHLSLYALEVHPKTQFGHLDKGGKLNLPSEDLSVQYYEVACDALKKAGYVHYEISNWALPGFESKHNLSYWKTRPCFALGVGGHGYYKGRRYANPSQLKGYYEMCQSQQFAWQTTPQQPRSEAIEESVFMGLRLLKEGLDKRDFETRFGLSLDACYPDLPRWVEAGWLHESATHLRLSAEAVMYSNEVFMKFLDPALEAI